MHIREQVLCDLVLTVLIDFSELSFSLHCFDRFSTGHLGLYLSYTHLASVRSTYQWMRSWIRFGYRILPSFQKRLLTLTLIFCKNCSDRFKRYIKQEKNCFIKYPDTRGRIIKLGQLPLVFVNQLQYSMFGFHMKQSVPCLIFNLKIP